MVHFLMPVYKFRNHVGETPSCMSWKFWGMLYFWGTLQLVRPHLNHCLWSYDVFVVAQCCSGIFEIQWPFTPTQHTLDGRLVRLERRRNGITINRIPVRTCDTMATNGVIHSIDQFLPEAVRAYGGMQRQRNGHTGGSIWDLHRRRNVWDDLDLDIDFTGIDWRETNKRSYPPFNFQWNNREPITTTLTILLLFHTTTCVHSCIHKYGLL